MTFSSVSSSRAQIGDDGAVAKNIDVVAFLQLFGFGRVPEEGPPCRASVADQIVDFELGAVRRRRASDRPSARCAHPSRARGRTAPSADCRRRATGCCCGRRACGSRSCRARNWPAPSSRRGEISRPGAQPLRASARRCSPRSTIAGRCRRTCRSPGDQRHRRRDLRAARGREAAAKDGEQQIGLAVAGEAGKADDLALMRDEFAARPSGASARTRTRSGDFAARRGRSRPLARRGLRSRRRPWRATSLSRSKTCARVVGDDLAVAHHDDAVAVLQHLAQNDAR